LFLDKVRNSIYARVKELLEILVLLGQARQLAEGQFVG
jgi:hypothetical protein